MEMLLLSEERECGKMKKKKIMFIILCMLTVLAAGTAHATEKERVDPLQPAIAEKILRFHVLANSDAKDDQNVKLKVRHVVAAGFLKRRGHHGCAELDWMKPVR